MVDVITRVRLSPLKPLPCRFSPSLFQSTINHLRNLEIDVIFAGIFRRRGVVCQLSHRMLARACWMFQNMQKRCIYSPAMKKN